MKSIILKNAYPVYPVVKAEQVEKKFVFSTLVRKHYDGTYYLILMTEESTSEARAIHLLHSKVYKYLMLGELSSEDIEDEEQVGEKRRLTLIK